MGTPFYIIHLKSARTIIALVSFILSLLSACLVKAQVNNYTVSQNSVYPNYISYGTNNIQTERINSVLLRRKLFINNVISSANSAKGKGFPIGFDFWFDGQKMNSMAISSNGYIKLGDSLQGITMLNDTSIISFYQQHPQRENIIAAFMRSSYKIAPNYDNWSVIDYGTSGYPGEQVTIITFGKNIIAQQSPLQLYSTSSSIRLYQFDNTVEILNRSDITTPIAKDTAIVGILGAGGISMNNYSTRKVTAGVNDWKTSVSGTTSDGFCEFSSTLRPVHASSPYNPVPISYSWKPSPRNTVPECPIAYFKQFQPGNPNFIFADKYFLTNDGYILASNAVEVQLVQTLYWSPLYSISPVQYDLYLGMDSIALSPIATNLTTNFFKLPTLSGNTRYYYKVITHNSNGTSPSCIYSFTTGTDLGYCAAQNGRNATLQNFKLNTMNYSMTGTLDNTPSYPASVYNTELKRDTSYKFQYTAVTGLPCFTIRLFIDFNHNGILNDPGEQFNGNNSTIIIPRTALLGPTKMRIAQDPGCTPTSFGPCNAWNAQDFVVTIIPESICKSFSMSPVYKGSTCYNSNDGNISLNIAGGTTPYSYSWLKNNSAITESATANNLGTGTYQCTVKDANNCILATSAIALAQPMSMRIDTTSISGSMVANVTGGTAPYNYEWFDGINTYFDTPPEGSYTLTVTDVNNCTVQMVDVIVRKSVPTGIDNVKNYDRISLYPNPSTGLFTMSLNDTAAVLTVLDTKGIIVRQQNLVNAETIIDLNEQNKGIYFFKIITDHSSQVIKVLIE